MVRTKSKRDDSDKSEVAGNSLRGGAAEPASILDASAQAAIAESATESALEASTDDDLAAMSIRPPDESESIPFTIEQMAVMGFTDSDDEGPAPPAWYVSPGERITPEKDNAFRDAHLKEIDRVLFAVVERVAPFAVEDSIERHYFPLLYWNGRRAYIRGFTEEHFVAASVTYQAINGGQFTVPIYFEWATGAITAVFNADRVGR